MPRSCRFEPSIDYVVTKIPRFAFEKFPQAGVAAFGRKPPFNIPASLRVEAVIIFALIHPARL
ncbi:MAG TPA: hypothetical protein DCQ92_01170 [Verrucomicrobia subdivision 3 bacterium]|nr:hypothetical protein [Limisphaerales bacterium]